MIQALIRVLFSNVSQADALYVVRSPPSNSTACGKTPALLTFPFYRKLSVSFEAQSRTATATHSFEDRGRGRACRCAPQGFMAFNAKEGRRKREGEGSAQRILDIVARLPLCSIPPSSADILRLSLQRLPRLGTVAGAGGSPSSLPLSPTPSCRVQTDRNREGSERGTRETEELDDGFADGWAHRAHL